MSQTTQLSNNRRADRLADILRSEPTSARADKVFAALRVVAGLSLAINFGLLSKVPVPEWFISDIREHMWYLPFPVFWAWAATLAEVVGGFLLAFGLFTRPAAFFIICTMIGAATFQLTVSGNWWNAMASMVYFSVATFHLMLGSGRYGLDAKLIGWLERRS